jgi:hypothetical protein
MSPVVVRVAVEIRFALNCAVCVCGQHQAITAYVPYDKTELRGFYTSTLEGE